jgi:hypothetical protein
VERIDIGSMLIEERGRVLVVHNRAWEQTRRTGGFRAAAARTERRSARRPPVKSSRKRGGWPRRPGRLVAVGEFIRDTHDVWFVFGAQCGIRKGLAPGG